MALLHCELRLGAAWVHAPDRWPTADGSVPVRLVWSYFGALQMDDARDALNTARGIGLAFGGDDAGRVADRAFDDAYPESPER